MERVGRLSFALSFVCACGLSARGEQGIPPDAVLPDATAPIGDASTNDAGDATLVDAGPPQCVTFANTIAPFAYEGDAGGYTLGAQGVTLSMGSGKDARLHRTFDAGKPYTRSIVDVHLGATTSGSWGANGSDYMTLLSEFYGATRVRETSTRLDLTLAQDTTELNVWAPNQITYRLGGMKIPGADTHVVMTTEWATGDNGRVTVAMNPTTGVPIHDEPNIATVATPKADKLTVVIGGNGANAVPTMTLVVFDVCVSFAP